MKKIAIIGCGISGLYFANKLLSEKIYDFTIYEKKSELDLNDGYGIQLSVNSVRLLNEIGFNNTANVYSISNSSKLGGKLDWINENGIISVNSGDSYLLNISPNVIDSELENNNHNVH